MVNHVMSHVERFEYITMRTCSSQTLDDLIHRFCGNNTLVAQADAMLRTNLTTQPADAIRAHIYRDATQEFEYIEGTKRTTGVW